jgi:two-component system OmpR family sensor kinase
MIIHSIKWRLQAWHSFLLVTLVAGLMTGFYTYERRSRLAAMDADLREAMTPLLPRLAPPGPGPRGPGGPGNQGGPSERFRRPPPEDEMAPRERPAITVAERYYFVAWGAGGERIAASTNAPANLPLPKFAGPKEGSLLRTRGEDREIAHLVPNGTIVLVGASLAEDGKKLRQLAYALTFIGTGIVVVGLAVGWWLATRALRPIAEIGQAAQKIAAGDLANRINATDSESELGQLITVLNSTFARLETAFAQQQQFTSDAAHELRTPVSVILTQVQSTLNKERSGAEYRETLEACQRAAQRMKRLIESLLELARFDAGQEQLKRMPFDLAAKTQECIELLQPLAVERGVKITADLGPANCSGDPERLSQVVTNLLTNAITYNRPDGEVGVAVVAQNSSVILTVSDTGVGIASTDVPHVFKRFYRADKSRSGTAGNAGLGLAICKSIVAAHGGTLDFTSEPDRGTTFTLRLPAA